MPIGAAGVAAITAAGGLAMSGVNAASTGRTNRKTRKWNEHMYSKQYADNIALWNMQNEYNSPEQQMARLKKAGLNPNLVYGDGNAGAVSRSAPSGADVKPWNPDTPLVDPGLPGQVMSTYYNTQQQIETINNLKKQSAVIDQEAKLKDAQTTATLKQAGYTDQQIASLLQDIDYKSKLNPISLQAAQSNVNKTEHEIQKIDADITYTRDQNERSNIALQNTLKDSQIGRTKTAAEIKEISSRIVNLVLEGKIKEYEVYLNTLGINKNDSPVMRAIQKAVQSSPKWNGKVLPDWMNKLFNTNY